MYPPHPNMVKVATKSMISLVVFPCLSPLSFRLFLPPKLCPQSIVLVPRPFAVLVSFSSHSRLVLVSFSRQILLSFSCRFRIVFASFSCLRVFFVSFSCFSVVFSHPTTMSSFQPNLTPRYSPSPSGDYPGSLQSLLYQQMAPFDVHKQLAHLQKELESIKQENASVRAERDAYK
jgi:hypothetical protein